MCPNLSLLPCVHHWSLSNMNRGQEFFEKLKSVTHLDFWCDISGLSWELTRVERQLSSHVKPSQDHLKRTVWRTWHMTLILHGTELFIIWMPLEDFSVAWGWPEGIQNIPSIFSKVREEYTDKTSLTGGAEIPSKSFLQFLLRPGHSMNRFSKFIKYNLNVINDSWKRRTRKTSNSIVTNLISDTGLWKNLRE